LRSQLPCVALILLVTSGAIYAQDATSLTPDQQAFARDMLACSQKYVALRLLEPGSSTPAEIVNEGRVYIAAAQQVAGDAFVEAETNASRQAAMSEVAKLTEGGKRVTTSQIAKIRKTCDARLADYRSGRP
jgi:hypothetical protein